jgi:16S rRNA processing protein RimM
MPPPETPVTVGRIVAPHGIRGEVKVEPLSDFPQRFEAGSVLWLRDSPCTVERGRWQGRTVILKLEGVETRNEAEALRGKELTVPEAIELNDDGVYYLHDIVGLQVEDQGGAALGSLAEVLSTGATDVYVVRGDRGELLLPALDDVILDIDLTNRRIVVEVPEGIEYQGTAAKARPRNRRPPQRQDGKGYGPPGT